MRVQRQQLRASTQLTPKSSKLRSLPERPSFSLSDKEDIRQNRLHHILQKLESNSLHNKQQLYELLSCYSFFEKINSANPLVFNALKPHITVEVIPKGKIVAMFGEKALKSYLILKGRVGVYVRTMISSDKSKSYKEEYGEELVTDAINKNPVLKRKSTMIQEENAMLSFNQRRAREYEKTFESQDEMIEWFPDLTRVGCMRQEEAIDVAALKKIITRAATLVTEETTILVGLSKASFLEVTSKLQLHTVLDDRLDLLRNFPIFSGWEKKLNAMAVYFERRKFQRGQAIYKQGNNPDCFYLIIEGDVELSVQVHYPRQPTDQSVHISEDISKVPINILGPGNYFGEEEILMKTARKMTAQPLSAYVQVLYLTKKNFFIVGYGTDFFYQLKLNIQVKANHRQNVVSRYSKFQGSLHPRKQKTPERSNLDCKIFLNRPVQKTKLSRINNHQPIQDGDAVVFLHGNKITIPKIQLLEDTSPVPFSMLECNEVMYKETQKKFRRFHKKEQVKRKSEVNWDMKRVWKVLNLEEILPEEIVSDDNPIRKDKEAIKYYYKSNRLANQISESRALRPRTSSSSHRQKQTYINYLSEFIESANRRISLA